MLYPLSAAVDLNQSFDNNQMQQGGAPMQNQSFDNNQLQQGGAPMQSGPFDNNQLQQGGASMQSGPFDNNQLQQGSAPMQNGSFDNNQLQQGNAPMQSGPFDNNQLQQGSAPMQNGPFDNNQMQQGNAPMQNQSFDNNQMQQGGAPIQNQPVDNNQLQQDTTQQNLQGSFAQNNKRVNALSLSSIRKKRELESSLEKNIVDPEDLPRLLFSFEQMMNEWQLYMQKLSRTGYMLMSSLMGMTQPRLEKHLIYLELPNHGSKLSFDENKYELVNHLRKKLSNYDIEIIIEVN
ncbi:hypothetical protein, partial [Myroides sp. LoEW2-1]|uniref:hypothetical protein n=1 Tax=Myroides sp. LoEW2-1 TaxID=2683192 RepID=UPI0013271142